MNFTIYRTDKQKQLHVSTKRLERFLGRIVKDDSKQTVSKFREVAPCLEHGYAGYKDILTWQHVCPAAEFAKDENGNLRLKKNNGVLLLCFTQIEEEGGMEAAKQKVACLPSTLAAFMGADGISLIVLVKYAMEKQKLPHDEAEAEKVYRQAFHVFAPLYQVLYFIVSKKSKCYTFFNHSFISWSSM